jgi:hypothetical protein
VFFSLLIFFLLNQARAKSYSTKELLRPKALSYLLGPAQPVILEWQLYLYHQYLVIKFAICMGRVDTSNLPKSNASNTPTNTLTLTHYSWLVHIITLFKTNNLSPVRRKLWKILLFFYFIIFIIWLHTNPITFHTYSLTELFITFFTELHCWFVVRQNW